ncbi:sensor domain-containing protein [Neobacillus jeddahensis]|uniref:sensor domain-containing protein n=1 Tax=Neobacillus jeddahensis TaxID=1461580 RepID=UPI000693B17B|nr:EAL domain-containing protein [Neobacillus jeddahensis]
MKENTLYFLLVILSIMTSIVFSFTAYGLLARVKGVINKQKNRWLISGAILLVMEISFLLFSEIFSLSLPYTIEHRRLMVLIALFVSLLSSIASFLFIVSFDRKFSEQSQKILLHEQYYQSLFEENPDPILTFDLEGKILNANKAVHDYGFTIKEIINKPFTFFLVPKDIDSTVEHFINTTKGIACTYECRMIDKKGQKRELSATNIPIYLRGKIIGVYGIIKDLTQHKKAQKDLMEAEAKYRILVENSLVGVYIILEEKFVYVNPRLCEIGGYSRNELMELNLVDTIVPEDIPIVLETIKKLSLNEISTSTYQYRAIRKDRSIVYLEIFASKIEYNGKAAIIGTVIDITKRIRTEKIIKHMAYHDQLTGLPNRYLFCEKINDVVRNSKEFNKHFAILFMDLDRFKTINDTLGHELGDRLLIEFGKGLKSCIKATDIVSRYGGDEFAILLPDSNAIRALKVSGKILAHFSVPIELDPHEILVTPSIGISIFPEHGENFDTLIKNADLAMYHAKNHHLKNIQFFSDIIKSQYQHEMNVELELRKAIEQEEFILYYQPLIDLETNQIIGAEALIRWEHPVKGLISPANFISIAEESGLIIPIGEWVIQTACRQNKDWQLAGFPLIKIAVNISAKQFFQSNLVELIQDVLEKNMLEPKWLELEITESMTMDIDGALSTMMELKKLGVKMSIDDFGSGYSSLNYLKTFPIDTLKIDQSFIRECTSDPNDETIVKTIIAMAHNLNLQVIAEGVETKEQVDFLRQQMCTMVQGYYYSKPVPAQEFEKLLQNEEKRGRGK